MARHLILTGISQGEINELLVSKALAGHRVVRLKGGDPAVFGRVGEEAESLKDEGIPFEVIPGVTSSIAASMYAGVPVTHRDYGRSFAMVTGHDQTKKDIDWNGLVSIDTVAFYMGVANLPSIREKFDQSWKAGEYTGTRHSMGALMEDRKVSRGPWMISSNW
ncbi:SAM-dependent methyltransferase [Peribacillus frigoritolerans]|nr:SAM-dependent methyltransferase [Peribacillus frigoritolerans]